MGKIKYVVISVILLSLIVLLGLPLSLSDGVLRSGPENEELTLLSTQVPLLPSTLVQDARKLAEDLFGKYQEKCDSFVSQLLATYLEAKDKDFAIIFNPGGWGWASVEASPGWPSISNGITSVLKDMGYTSTLLDFQRTERSWSGRLDEFVGMFSFKSERAKDLASRLSFLTSHLPGLRIILTGESNGTVYNDHVMTLLKNNPRVFSIQTGTPFWHNYMNLERTLIIDDDGTTKDTFSSGDIITAVCANIESLLGLSKPEPGNILIHILAPGHFYSWDNQSISSRITDFLKTNFSYNYQ